MSLFLLRQLCHKGRLDRKILGTIINYFINQTIFDCLMGLQILDSAAVLDDRLYRFTTSGCNQFTHGSSIVGNLLGLDGNIGCLSTSLRTWLI
mmetsp:Transcript_49652/g.144356  ORF Transcript_49652/g.144356 Transcript_49652/m.144356 type:complete len:93 (-) Transcript_49652:658-936(-)